MRALRIPSNESMDCNRVGATDDCEMHAEDSARDLAFQFAQLFASSSPIKLSERVHETSRQAVPFSEWMLVCLDAPNRTGQKAAQTRAGLAAADDTTPHHTTDDR